MANGGYQLMLDALTQVADNANPSWKIAAFRTVVHLAVRFDEFTADHVWEYMEKHYPNVETHEPRAMGAILRNARSCGYIEPTGRYVPSRRATKHCSPTAVWRSVALVDRGEK